MRAARWELQTDDVPISRVVVRKPSGDGFHIQLGAMCLWVSSQAHWEDINEQVMACFADLAPARVVPLPRKGPEDAA